MINRELIGKEFFFSIFERNLCHRCRKCCPGIFQIAHFDRKKKLKLFFNRHAKTDVFCVVSVLESGLQNQTKLKLIFGVKPEQQKILGGFMFHVYRFKTNSFLISSWFRSCHAISSIVHNNNRFIFNHAYTSFFFNIHVTNTPTCIIYTFTKTRMYF